MLSVESVEFGNPSTTLKEVGCLRYDIYCNEEKLPYKASNHCLIDKLDLSSISLIAYINGEMAGTVRVTPKLNTPLELEAQSPEWKRIIETKPKEHTFEINRFAVSKKFRGTIIPFELILQEYEYAAKYNLSHGYIAGKVGVLERFYMSMGAIKLTSTPSVYKVNDIPLGNYNLLYFDVYDENVRRRITAWKKRCSSNEKR